MKLTTNRKQLMTALDMVSGAIEKRTTIPILANVLLTVQDDGLHIAGTDLEFAVQTWIPGCDAGEGQDGIVTVPFLAMQKFVNRP